MNWKINLSPFLSPFLLVLAFILLSLSQTVSAVYWGCPSSIKNSYECAQYLEQVVKKSGELKFTRNNGTLILPLRSGNKIYRNSGAIGNSQKYSAVQYFKKTNHVVIHVQYWESSSYLLLNLQTGDEYVLAGNPVLSPNSERIVVARMDIDIGLNPNSIAVYRFTNGGLTKEYMYAPSWGPSNLEWQGDTKISLRKNYFDTTGGTVELKTRKVYLKLEGDKWRLVD